jgi:uncharacterized protein YndB with AHSA1/START domain
MLTRRLCLAGAIACLASPLLAGEPRPDATIKNKSFEARVYLDDTIKADPALAADCLAEGRKWMAKSAADAEGDRRQDPQLFRDGGWTFERRYNFRSRVDGHYVSIVRGDYMDTRAAHPNSDVNTILWDSTAGRRISIRPFFTETADNGPTMKAIVKAVLASLTAEKKKRGAGETATSEWFKGVEPNLLKIGAVTLAPSTEQGKSFRPDLPLSALCRRSLCRRRVCRLRALGDVEALFDARRHQDIRRRAAKGRRRRNAIAPLLRKQPRPAPRAIIA